MGRRPYHQIVTERVKFLQTDRSKMIRFGRGDPSFIELGDVFSEVCRRVEAEQDSSILRAFNACALDLDNPFHWGDLMGALCDIHFGKRKTKKRKLTNEFRAQFAKDVRAMQIRYRTKDQLQLCRHLRKNFPDRYGDYASPESLRRLFSEKTGRKK